MSNGPLLVEHVDGVDRVTLNRPDSLNALDTQMVDALNVYFAGLARNERTRVVVLKGAGRAFCAGLDLKEAMSRRPADAPPATVAEALDHQRHIADIVMLMRRCPQPIIALVQGAASGGGFALALAADIQIAAKSARMNCAFIRLGLGGCDIGTSYFLPRLVGVSIASEIDPDRTFHRRRARLRCRPGLRAGRGQCARRCGAALCRGDARGIAARAAAVEGMPQHECRCRVDRGRDRDGGPQPGSHQPVGGFQGRHSRLPGERNLSIAMHDALPKPQ